MRRVDPTPWQEICWVARKDLRLERYSLGIAGGSALLAAGVVCLCALAGDQRGRAELAGAAVWVSMAFSGVMAASAAYAREKHDDTLTALLCGPLRTVSLFVGKTLPVLLWTLMGTLAAALLAAILIHARALLVWPFHTLGVLAAGALGFSVVGGLVAPLLGAGSGRDVVLALVLLPLGVPVVIAGARASASLGAVKPPPGVYGESLGLILALDIMFLLLALWLFGPMVRRGT